MESIFQISITFVLLLTLPYVSRVIKGPTVFDRLQALNALGTKVPVLFVLIGLLYERAAMFIDLAIALFLLNLFTTLLVAKYMSNVDLVDSVSQKGQ